MNEDVLLAILYLFIAISLVAYSVYCFKEAKKEFRLRDERRVVFLETLKHGAIFAERLLPERDNPFLPRQQKNVTVLETRINQYGETWVKYQEEGNPVIWYCPAQNFDKLYVKQ